MRACVVACSPASVYSRRSRFPSPAGRGARGEVIWRTSGQGCPSYCKEVTAAVVLCLPGSLHSCLPEPLHRGHPHAPVGTQSLLSLLDELLDHRAVLAFRGKAHRVVADPHRRSRGGLARGLRENLGRG